MIDILSLFLSLSVLQSEISTNMYVVSQTVYHDVLVGLLTTSRPFLQMKTNYLPITGCLLPHHVILGRTGGIPTKVDP